MNSFINWLGLVMCLREPTPEESVQQLRAAAKKILPYSETTAARLEQQADAEEKRHETV